MSALWQGLLANLAILAILITAWTQADEWMDRWPRWARAIVVALATSGGTLALMALPFEIQSGIFVDLRGTLIVLSGFFGGPVVGITTALTAGAYRVALGGAGWWGGTIGVGIAMTVGVAGNLLLRNRAPRNRDVVLLAGVTALTSLVGFFFLPAKMWATLIPQVGPPILTMIFVSTFAFGFAILQESRRRETARENQMYRAVIDALPDPLNAKDLDGRFLAANPATAELMQAQSASALIGRTDFDFYPAATARRFRQDEVLVLSGGMASNIEQQIENRNGTTISVSALKVPLRDSQGRITGLLTLNRDITQRKVLEDELAKERNRLATALASMADGLVLFDRDRRLVFCNEQYLRLFPKTADVRVPGARMRDILQVAAARGEQAGLDGRNAEAWIQSVYASMEKASEREIATEDGRWLHVRIRPTADGGALSVISDITAAKQAAAVLAEVNGRLEKLANTDGLTGLINRRTFDEVLDTEVARGAREELPVSLLLIDIDRFKAFNDTYGHPAGDACLRRVSQCLGDSLKRPGDLAARYGGEEMAVLLPNTPEEGAFQVAEGIRAAVRALGIVHAGSEQGWVTVSIGVATSLAADAGEPSRLVQRSDEALYAAKAAGRNRVRSWQTPVEPIRSIAGARRSRG